MQNKTLFLKGNTLNTMLLVDKNQRIEAFWYSSRIGSLQCSCWPDAQGHIKSTSISEPSVVPKKTFFLKEYEVMLPEEFAPRFSLLLRNRFIQDGRSAKLTCTADANPTATMTWYKVTREANPSNF